MPSSITPAPPGYDVEFAERAARRFGPPSTQNLFAIVFADRGDIGQAAGVTDLIDGLGARVNYSSAFDALATALAEGTPMVTWSRIVGPAAVAATKTISGSISITAKTKGEWGNNLTYQVTEPDDDQVQLIIRESGEPDPVATSPVCTTVAELVAWTDDDANGVVNIGTGAALPAVAAATALTGGDDDREHVTVTEIQTALDRLDKRYGPGRFIAPGIDDPDFHKAILAHCKATGRRARLDLASTATKQQAEDYQAALYADVPDLAGYGLVIGSWAYTIPVVNEPERLVPYSAVQVGVEARVESRFGVATPTYGPTNGYATTVTRLLSEWSDADRTELYAHGINVATDDGAAISLWGYKTLSDNTLDQDAHAQNVRMAFKFDAEAIARSMIGQLVDKGTVASYVGRLEILSKAYQDARAIQGYVIDGDSVNTPASMARRELHAVETAQFGNSTDWADLLITVVPTDQNL